jgi:hypothetical protein
MDSPFPGPGAAGAAISSRNDLLTAMKPPARWNQRKRREFTQSKELTSKLHYILSVVAQAASSMAP